MVRLFRLCTPFDIEFALVWLCPLGSQQSRLGVIITDSPFVAVQTMVMFTVGFSQDWPANSKSPHSISTVPKLFFDYVFHVQNHSNHWDTLTKFYLGFFMNTLLYKLLNLLPVPCPPSKRAQAM